jgi:hypothetical protein
MDPALQTLLARDAIREVLGSYARAIDRGDAALLKSCYHADAIEEHGGNYTGNAHDYVDAAIPRVMRMGAMQHLLGTSFIDLQGNTAWVETYVWTFVRFESDERCVDTFTGGRLIDRFECRDGAWKIAHRRTVFDWNRDTPSNETWCLGLFTPGKPGMLQGRKGTADPSYERE